jgi:hypothetical protein
VTNNGHCPNEVPRNAQALLTIVKVLHVYEGKFIASNRGFLRSNVFLISNIICKSIHGTLRHCMREYEIISRP